MKVKYNKQKTISIGTQGVSAGGGVLASRIGMSYAPSAMKKPIPRLAIAAVAIGVAASITGTGLATDVAKGVVLGIGLDNLVEGTKGLVAPTLAVNAADGTTKAKMKLLASKAFNTEAAAMNGVAFLPSANAWSNAPVAQERVLPVENVV